MPSLFLHSGGDQLWRCCPFCLFAQGPLPLVCRFPLTCSLLTSLTRPRYQPVFVSWKHPIECRARGREEYRATSPSRRAVVEPWQGRGSISECSLVNKKALPRFIVRYRCSRPLIRATRSGNENIGLCLFCFALMVDILCGRDQGSSHTKTSQWTMFSTKARLNGTLLIPSTYSATPKTVSIAPFLLDIGSCCYDQVCTSRYPTGPRRTGPRPPSYEIARDSMPTITQRKTMQFAGLLMTWCKKKTIHHILHFIRIQI